MTTIEAVYEGGKFTPLAPVDLAEHARVRLNVEAEPAAEMSDEEFERRLAACNTWHDFIEFSKDFPADDGSYDILERLRANRLMTGEIVPKRAES